MAHIVLSPEDDKIIDEWLKTHDILCPVMSKQNGSPHRFPKVGMLGARLIFTIIPTNMGIMATVKCSCGEHIDLSPEGG